MDDQTLEELIANGAQKMKDLDWAEKQAKDEEVRRSRRERREAQDLIRELLPQALQEYTFFENWHNQYYDFNSGQGWTVQALIECPKLAPIRILCIGNLGPGTDDHPSMSLYSSRYGTEPYSVLEWKAEKHDGEWYAVEHKAWSGADIELALYHAAQIGLTKERVEAEVEKLGAELAASPQIPVVIDTPESRLIWALRDFIQAQAILER